MSLSFALLLLATHGLPILFFAYMSTEVLVRNVRSVEHVLLSIISFLYLLLFAEEYVRAQVPIEHSPLLSAIWFSVGLFYYLNILCLETSWMEIRFPRQCNIPNRAGWGCASHP